MPRRGSYGPISAQTAFALRRCQLLGFQASDSRWGVSWRLKEMKNLVAGSPRTPCPKRDPDPHPLEDVLARRQKVRTVNQEAADKVAKEAAATAVN
jgi:hypothetical protein